MIDCITVCFYTWLFFFFKQKTAYEMRIRYLSSDVCSSDLRHGDIAWTIALHEADAGPQRQRFRNRGSRLVGELCAIDARCGLRDRLCILPPTGNHDGLDRHTLAVGNGNGGVRCRARLGDRKSTRLKSSHKCTSRLQD